MASQVDICNSALVKLGQGVSISALTDRSPAAVIFNRCWTRVLDEVLEEHPWPFTVTAAALALDAQSPFPGWAYRYARPDDCLSALAVCSEAGVRGVMAAYCNGEPSLALSGAVAFDSVHGTQQACLVTDLAEAYLIYAARVSDASRFSASFCDLLACRLAMEAAPTLAGELGLRMADKLRNDYEIARTKAITRAFNESRETVQPVTPSIAARGGY